MLIRWLFLKKNTILVWNRLGVIVSMLSSRGVPSFQSFSNPKRAFVNDARIVKVYAMVEWPRMFCNVWAISTGFNIPDMFFLASFKATASFTYILQRILWRHEIQVINKPLKTLQQEFPSSKFRPSTEHQLNVVYKIPCADCGWCYLTFSVYIIFILYSIFIHRRL